MCQRVSPISYPLERQGRERAAFCGDLLMPGVKWTETNTTDPMLATANSATGGFSFTETRNPVTPSPVTQANCIPVPQCPVHH